MHFLKCQIGEKIFKTKDTNEGYEEENKKVA